MEPYAKNMLIKPLKPYPGSLFEAVEASLEMAYMIRVLGIPKAWSVVHVKSHEGGNEEMHSSHRAGE